MATNPKKIVYLNQTQLNTISAGGSVTVGDDTYTADMDCVYLLEKTKIVDVGNQYGSIGYNEYPLISKANCEKILSAGKTGEPVAIKWRYGNNPPTYLYAIEFTEYGETVPGLAQTNSFKINWNGYEIAYRWLPDTDVTVSIILPDGVTDVTVNDESIVTDGVAEIPYTTQVSYNNSSLVSSGGVYNAIQSAIPFEDEGDLLVAGPLGKTRLPIGSPGEVLKVNSAGTGLEYGIDDEPTQNSNNPVKSGGVYTSLDKKLGVATSNSLNLSYTINTSQIFQNTTGHNCILYFCGVSNASANDIKCYLTINTNSTNLATENCAYGCGVPNNKSDRTNANWLIVPKNWYFRVYTAEMATVDVCKLIYLED